jgi:hypothetical protein
MGYLSVGNYIGTFPVWNAARLIPLAECTKTNSGRQMAAPLLFLRYGASTAFLLERAFEEARVTPPNHVRWLPLRQAVTANRMARQILAAVDAGERDHDQLVQAALLGIDRS